MGGMNLSSRGALGLDWAPVFLDSSPPPPKKRGKVDKGSGMNGAEKVKREDGVKCETPCSSSRDLEGENNGWLSRLRARGSSASFGGRARGESSPRGKRKHFENLNRFKEGTKTQLHDKNVLFAGGKSTVVKSKRPGRIKASNVLENEN
ncbi:uncharacterized protein Fot_45025 [Forsythia ovata]|uniref:Uncharacterized protein n=1 Tax=Forsythia ovata TaxID=205694 RepID=A0ABD1R722_9LAMI